MKRFFMYSDVIVKIASILGSSGMVQSVWSESRSR